MVTYAVAAFITFGLPMILGSILLVLGTSTSGWQSMPGEVVLLYVIGAVLCTNPAATALLTQYVLLNEHTLGTFSYTLSSGQTIPLISPWIPFTVLYLALTVVFSCWPCAATRRSNESERAEAALGSIDR